MTENESSNCITSHELKGMPDEDKLRGAVLMVSAIVRMHKTGTVHGKLNSSSFIFYGNPPDRCVISGFDNTNDKPADLPAGIDSGLWKLSYSSPESIRGDAVISDLRSDLYSAGVVLYEIFAGQRPLEYATRDELIHAHIAVVPVEPSVLRNDIPEALSGIIMKLLAKDPDDRYDDAAELLGDFEFYIKQRDSGKTVSAIKTGRPVLNISGKFYGRNSELEQLLTGYMKVHEGSSKMIIISGQPGAGKTALVNRLVEMIGAEGCIYGSGKFNYRDRVVPYSAITEAFTMMVHRVLSYNEHDFHRLRRRFIESLEPNCAIITDLIPDFELIIGQPQPLSSTGPVESKYRFMIWVSMFVSIFTESGLPVVLFLDDLQWADSASLDLVNFLMLNSDITGLLVIGAHREGGEYTKDHLGVFLEEAAGISDKFEKIRLGGVDEACIIEMVKDSLESSGNGYSDLGKRIFRRTGGNPYFSKEYLKDVYSQGLITESSGIWKWDCEKLEMLPASDGLASILSQSMTSLNENMQRVLTAGACAGWSFDEGLIAAVLRMKEGDVRSLLEGLCSAGYILACGSGYRFTHDKVRETAYSLMPERNRQIFHRRAGRVLYGMASTDDEFFRAVEQMNLGSDLISSIKEKTELVQLNLEAGIKSKKGAAFSSALSYLRTAYEMLPENSWIGEYELTSSIYRELAEVHCVEGNYESSDDFIDRAVNNVKTDFERAEFYYIRILHYHIMARHHEGIEVGKKALSLLNVFIQESNHEFYINDQLVKINKYIEKNGIDAICRLPEATDNNIILAVKILNKVAATAFFCDLNVLVISALLAADLSVTYGISKDSSSVFSGLGNINAMRGNYDAGYIFMNIALRLTEKFSDPGNKCVVFNMTANNINFWYKHIRESEILNDSGFKSGIESGELIFAGMISCHIMVNSFHAGIYLKEILSGMTSIIKFNMRTRNVLSLDILYGIRRIILNLTGDTSGTLVFDMDNTCEQEYIDSMLEHKDDVMLTQYYMFKVQVFYLYREYNSIIKLADLIEKNLEYIMCVYTAPEFIFYYTLALIAISPSSDENTKQRYSGIIRANQKKMKEWSDQCKVNFEHKYLLVEAELAALQGNVTSAVDFYTAGIESAAVNLFIQNEALGNELAGRFWLRQGREDYAMVHLKRARSGYEKWGAVRKVNLLDEEFPSFSRQSDDEAHSSETNIAESPGGLALVKSLQAISGEIEFEKLMHTLMRNMLQYEGGTRIVLFIEKDNRLCMEAEGYVEQESGVIKTVMHYSLPIDECAEIPSRLVRYCARTGETIILNDAVSGRIPVDSDYIKKGRAKSVLCVKSSSGTTAVLVYIENSLTKNVFTPGRVEVLKLLAVQAAISSENSRLYREQEESAKRLAEMGEAREKLLRQYEEARHNAMIERTNPHFLYNAIHTIHALIKMDPDEADRGTLMLAEIMRFLTDRSFEQLVSLEDEMRFVELYLSFEKIRFPDILTYFIKTEGILKNVMIPPLTIQPLVENAIKHGLRKKTEGGVIEINVSNPAGIVSIEVCDTGPGIGTGDLYSRTLGNIRDRLRYNFSNADVILKNGKDCGAVASVTFRFAGE